VPDKENFTPDRTVFSRVHFTVGVAFFSRLGGLEKMHLLPRAHCILSLPSAPPLRSQHAGEPSRPPPPVHEFIHRDVGEARERVGWRRDRSRGRRASDDSCRRPSRLRPPFRGRLRRWRIRRICSWIWYFSTTRRLRFLDYSNLHR
jgi:hypothetical protein